ERFGSDKPDTRFAMELIHVADIVRDSEFKVFQSAVENGGKVSLLKVEGRASHYSRKDIDKLTDYVKVYGAKGLAWLKIENTEIKGPIAKFLSDKEKEKIVERANANDGDLLLFVADKTSAVYDSLGALRLKLGKDLGLIDQSKFNFLWVTDWPWLVLDEDEGRYLAVHHPFRRPHVKDVDTLQSDP